MKPTPEYILETAFRASFIHRRYRVPRGLAYSLLDFQRRVSDISLRLQGFVRAEWRFLVGVLASICTPLTLVILDVI